ncbi:hypothetical protein [Peribacillus acanthi]|uniref:hypothetical protein n=1 Tax=Peribacillus acanthi TaxID=2171554 RepID=UPI000D3E56DF|nr:hypothetical protein [Peribacillus acanthi]
MEQEYRILLLSSHRKKQEFTIMASSIYFLKKKLVWYMRNEGYSTAHAWNENGEKVIDRYTRLK